MIIFSQDKFIFKIYRATRNLNTTWICSNIAHWMDIPHRHDRDQINTKLKKLGVLHERKNTHLEHKTKTSTHKKKLSLTKYKIGTHWKKKQDIYNFISRTKTKRNCRDFTQMCTCLFTYSQAASCTPSTPSELYCAIGMYFMIMCVINLWGSFLVNVPGVPKILDYFKSLITWELNKT